MTTCNRCGLRLARTAKLADHQRTQTCVLATQERAREALRDDGFAPLADGGFLRFTCTDAEIEVRFVGSEVWAPAWCAELLPALWRGYAATQESTTRRQRMVLRFLLVAKTDDTVRDAALVTLRVDPDRAALNALVQRTLASGGTEQ